MSEQVSLVVKQSDPQLSNKQGNEVGTRKVSGVLCDRRLSKNEGKGEQDSGWMVHVRWTRDKAKVARVR